MSKIAFFDFDGTITTKDTLIEFIKYTSGKSGLYKGFLFHLPMLIGYKAGIISNQKAKESILRHFYKNTSIEEFNQLSTNFSTDIVPTIIRAQALEEIKILMAQGFELVIVSASPENWIAPWAKTVGFTVLGTVLEASDGKITGKIEGFNCYGEEKVRRIKGKYNLAAYTTIYCYGDTKGDLPMLALADTSYYKPFR